MENHLEENATKQETGKLGTPEAIQEKPIDYKAKYEGIIQDCKNIENNLEWFIEANNQNIRAAKLMIADGDYSFVHLPPKMRKKKYCLGFVKALELAHYDALQFLKDIQAAPSYTSFNYNHYKG